MFAGSWYGFEGRGEGGVAEPLGCGLNAARLIFLGALLTSPPPLGGLVNKAF